jgi:putative acetyltransferase
MTLTAAPTRRRRAAPRVATAILPVDPQHPDALALLAAASEDARALYPELFGPHSPPPSNLPAVPRSIYLVAYLAGHAVGCGALRPLDALCAEVQRIYVRPAQRRQGVARAVMAHLEQHARHCGYRLLRLETGYKQAPALALYESDGWRRIPRYGPYADDPGSVCLEKDLA